MLTNDLCNCALWEISNNVFFLEQNNGDSHPAIIQDTEQTACQSPRRSIHRIKIFAWEDGLLDLIPEISEILSRLECAAKDEVEERQFGRRELEELEALDTIF